VISEPAAETAPPEPSRIVIIRRKADETVSVPLVDETQTNIELSAVSAA
jgi:hypothetical protein